MDVEMEGTLVVSNLDVDEAAGGSDTAFDVTRTVTVTDGQLHVRLDPDGDYAIVSGIVAREAD
jgi:hypothetical protein